MTRLPQEIRDECRGSTAVTRKTLIKIARKKQIRGMITAWNKYKEKVAKEAEGRKKQTKVAESAADQLKMVNKTLLNLDSLDIAAWTEEEKTSFTQTLTKLRKAIRTFLKSTKAIT